MIAFVESRVDREKGREDGPAIILKLEIHSAADGLLGSRKPWEDQLHNRQPPKCGLYSDKLIPHSPRSRPQLIC